MGMYDVILGTHLTLYRPKAKCAQINHDFVLRENPHTRKAKAVSDGPATSQYSCQSFILALRVHEDFGAVPSVLTALRNWKLSAVL
eukprot:6472361-Amphidinium_carterae.3